MEFNGKFEMNDIGKLMKDRGLGNGGRVQQFIDSEVIRLMAPYTPMLGGALHLSALWGSKIGSGLIEQYAPYARFQYYGKVMVEPETGSPWARKGQKKVETDKDLVHNQSKHPKAGPFWFERMKADHKDDILKGARKVAGIK